MTSHSMEPSKAESMITSLIEDVLVGRIGVPDTLNTGDVYGHGTCVGDISVFGDIKAQHEQAR